ncbi:tRNA (adenosine(37)-N6)-threonylcarbamoyltransferase complex dimerization subunit type 1 TsaB [Chitinophagaceae bacterium IBVUCB2]|nr:tRNA (adenosine(37)-N6)-threonylcarbamoyltransferase complex dimerization subunit type 1 TsaB [Chitinophagaceae bacterium IBVUCB2]
MSLILNIETSINTASICLKNTEGLEDMLMNDNQKDHAGWLHEAIASLLKKNDFAPADLDAVAVSIGPGSYTGLRVGLASAKGLCFVLNIPLIAIGTLKMMAFAVKDEVPGATICPMIDARRMEVFFAVYDQLLIEKIAPKAAIIDENFGQQFGSNEKIIFCGNGSKKLQDHYNSPFTTYSNTVANASHLANLAEISFQKNDFADLAYIEPLYIKEFYNPATR